MGPVWVLDLVQLGLREGVVEILDGHLVEGNHVLEVIQLRKCERTGYNYSFPKVVREVFFYENTASPFAHTEQCEP